MSKAKHVATTILLALSLFSRAAVADDLDFDQVCGNVLSAAQNYAQTSATTTPIAGVIDPRTTQKYTYCQSAQQDKKAASSNGALWKVWGAVAGVCAMACMSSFLGDSGKMICNVSNLGAAGTDAIVTKQFASSLMSAGIGFAAQKGLGKKGGGKAASCITAASAAFQVFTKKKTADSSSKDEQTNLLSASQISDPSATPLAVTAIALSAATAQSSVPTPGVVSFGAAKPTSVAAISPKAPSGNPCGNRDGGSILQCAIASDTTLPDFVKSNDFGQEVQANTGMPLGDFLSQSKDPSGSILAAGGGATDGSPVNANLSTLQGALADAKKSIDEDTSTTYVGGGGAPASGHAAASQDPPIGDMVAALMKGLGGGAEAKKDADASLLKFAPRAPASRASGQEFEDRNYSLFDRITYRYFFVGHRLLDKP